jgi:hypothetical protein
MVQSFLQAGLQLHLEEVLGVTAGSVRKEGEIDTPVIGFQ